MKTIILEMSKDRAKDLVDALEDSYDSGDAEFPYKSEKLQELLEFVRNTVEAQE